MSMMSLPPIHFPPPPKMVIDFDEHGDTSIINAPLEPQPLPIPSTRWYFDMEQLMDTPSRKQGIDADKELMFRQQSANFIQDMGQRLQVNQLCINTAIVYMHRFYMYHSFLQFQKNAISTASIFLAAKVEEQPRKLEYVIKISHFCLFHENHPPIDVKSDEYGLQATELVSNENILLQTLGFDVSVDHPHTHVVKCCQLVRANKDLAQTSYFMATNSLHLTTMCLQYTPSVVACVCIHLACKWSNWEVSQIPSSKEGKEWYFYVDGSVTPQQLESLTAEFLTIFNKSPSRLKKKILSLSNATSGGSGGSGVSLTNFPTHFTVERNSFGAQTIKSRSRSPSPPISPLTSNNKSSSRPPTVSSDQNLPLQLVKKMKSIPPSGVPSHYYGSKLIPPPGHLLTKHPLPMKPQFPHPPLQEQPNIVGSLGLSKDGHKHSMMKVQSTSHTPASSGSIQQGNRQPHGINIPSSQSHLSHPVACTQMQDGHKSSHHKQPIGSHSQSIHRPSPLPSNTAPRQHLFMKHELRPLATHASTHLSQTMSHHPTQNKESIQHPSTMKNQLCVDLKVPVSEIGPQNTPVTHIHRGFTRPPTGIRKSVNNDATQALNFVKSIPLTPISRSEYLKRRAVESTGQDPTPKRPRNAESQTSKLSMLPTVPEENASTTDIPKHVAIKTEPADSTDSWLNVEKKIDMKFLKPKLEPADSSSSIMSNQTLAPIQGSKVGLSNSANNHSASRYEDTKISQSYAPQMVTTPPSPRSTVSDVPTLTVSHLPLSMVLPKAANESYDSPSTSSKKKKKERKHKKDKDKEKKVKKHKKEKHRVNDQEKHQASKKKKSKSSESTISQNSLKIKIVASKEATDSNSNSTHTSSRTSTSKNQPSNTVVYYY